MATQPNFIDRDTAAIVADMKTYYEAQTGKTLQPAQVEILLINCFAYREGLLRSQIQSAALQMLVAFSTAPFIDFLGELVGVVRLPPASALCIIELTLVAGHLDITIPNGTRIQSEDGKVIFETVSDVLILAADLTATVDAICQTPGIIGNGYIAGKISNILDPQPYLTTAENTATTADGSDQESDDQLRNRIKLAPSAFSTAGPSGAYEYFAKSASPLILDVAVTNPVPGTVEVFPLTGDETGTPAPILAAVVAILNDEKIRPLTDTIIVTSPTAVTYTLTINATKLPDGVDVDIIAAITAAVEPYLTGASRKLGKDITDSKIIALSMVENVYSVDLDGFVTQEIDESEYGFCTSLTVAVVATDE